jgi:hypothetical protein
MGLTYGYGSFDSKFWFVVFLEPLKVACSTETLCEEVSSLSSKLIL